jgi:adenine-specific DNA-methyltransferase
MEFVPYENTDNVLDTVKPTRLLRRILQVTTAPNDRDLTLDFFAGSASMAHAVLDQNREDGGNRRFIMVQIPEPLPVPESKLKRMTDIGLTRVRNVIAKLSNSTGTLDRTDPEDLGFRVYKLDTSNIRLWDPNATDVGKTLLDSINHLKDDRSEADVLTELLLKLGLDLCVPIETKTMAGKPVHSIGGGVLFVCLAPTITVKQVEQLALGIVEWHKTLAPAGESQAVFRDSAFENDVAKTNLTAILAQYGLTNVRSL